MSNENVEIAREAFARFQAGDPAWSDWVHPEIEWDFSGNPLADLPNRGRGRDALLRDVIETYFSGWIDYQWVYWRIYPDWDSALKDLGLKE